MNKSTLQVSDLPFGWAAVFAQYCTAGKSRPLTFSFSDPNLLAIMTVLCLLANFIDVMTTSFGLCCFNGLGEGNAFANRIILKYGILGGLSLLSLIKIGAPMGLFGFLRSSRSGFRKALGAGLAVNIVMVSIAVANNVTILYND